MPFSSYTKNKMLDALFNNTSFVVALPYASLHTADPGDTGANECTGGSYARQSISAGAAGSGALDNDAIITFTGMPACTVTHFGVWTANVAGSFCGGNTLTASKTVQAGDEVKFPVGALDSSLT